MLTMSENTLKHIDYLTRKMKQLQAQTLLRTERAGTSR